MKKYILLVLPLIMSCSSLLNTSTNPNNQTSTEIMVTNKVNKNAVGFPVYITFNLDLTSTLKKTSDVKKIKLYLRTFSSKDNPVDLTDPLNSSTFFYTSGLLDYKQDDEKYNFFNLPSGKYYVGVEAFGDNLGKENIINGIGYTGDTGSGFKDGKRGLALSKNFVVINSETATVEYRDFSGELKSITSGFDIFPRLK